MIDKLISIDRIGIFHQYAAHGQTNFQKLTLLFAENGCGKTTLAAILKSLAGNRSDLISERKTLGLTGDSRVELRSSAANYIFANGQWSGSLPEMEVFDDAFVYDNVYSGPAVSLEQRRSLHRIIIGSRGVTLAGEIEVLDQETRHLSQQIRYLSDQIRPHISNSLTVDQFCELPQLEGVDQTIGTNEKDLDAKRNAAAIQLTGEFANVILPQVSIRQIEEILASGIDDLSAQAERRLQEHFAHIGRDAESWVGDGIARVVEDQCPFCTQDVSNIQIVRDYRIHFSSTYRELGARIARTQQDVGRSLGADNFARLAQQIAEQERKRAFWSKFVEVTDRLYPFDSIRLTTANLRDAVIQALAEKARAPLEVLRIPEICAMKVAEYEEVRASVDEITNQLTSVNPRIEEIKRNSDTGNIGEMESELAGLRAAKVRHSEPVVALCEQYQDARSRKAVAEERKSERREALEQHTAAIFPRYEGAINRYLLQFGADFRITGVCTENLGGKPGSRYYIKINSVHVELGNDSTPPGTPCFRTTLSAGDRNALALAFFLAQLDEHPQLVNKILVFDDPISSFDDGRMMVTKQIVCNMASRAAQVVVFSHSAGFLRKVWDQRGTPAKKALKLRKCASGVELTTWDIEDETRTEYHRLHALLSSYVANDGIEPRIAAQSIRPVLEGMLRVVYPNLFGSSEWLGDFVERAKSAAAAGRNLMPQVRLTELEALTDYSNRYHHNTNDSWATEPMNETELSAYARRTLDFIRL